MATVSASALDSLRKGFAGDLLVAGDAGYDDARALWNGDHDRRPALIARATSADDVAAAIAFAREQALEIAVRGGGHSYAGHGVLDDGLMIDLSPMNVGHRRCRRAPGALRRRHDLGRPRRGHAGARARGAGRRDQPHRRRRADARRRHRVAVAQARLELRQPRVGVGRDRRRARRARVGRGERRPALGVARRRRELRRRHRVRVRSCTRSGPMVNVGLFFWASSRAPKRCGTSARCIAGLPADAGAQIIGAERAAAPLRPRGAPFQARLHARDRRVGLARGARGDDRAGTRERAAAVRVRHADPLHDAAADDRRQRAVGHPRATRRRATSTSSPTTRSR